MSLLHESIPVANMRTRGIIQVMNFEAEVRQVKTMVDMSVNVTLNLPEYQLSEAQQLLAMIGELVSINLELIATGKQSDAVQARTKRKSQR